MKLRSPTSDRNPDLGSRSPTCDRDPCSSGRDIRGEPHEYPTADTPGVDHIITRGRSS
uniref:Uncharacterized protein n=1 Tax=Hyaloperonospora arabidopsidis (strain Emoy2) TaxID=559515 RepID=M4C4Z8_HYAAE